jgi:DNA-binding MarR family transcriptional regulator
MEQDLAVLPLEVARELRTLIGRLNRRLRAQANTGDLTWSQKAVLLHLEQGGAATVSTLARLEGVRSQSMGAIVAGLEEAGLVQGDADPSDGRQTLLSLTEVCRGMIATGRAAREDWLVRTMEAKLSADEIGELARAVRLLGRLAE